MSKLYRIRQDPIDNLAGGKKNPNTILLEYFLILQGVGVTTHGKIFDVLLIIE